MKVSLYSGSITMRNFSTADDSHDDFKPKKKAQPVQDGVAAPPEDLFPIIDKVC
jgi:hypothetical protein